MRALYISRAKRSARLTGARLLSRSCVALGIRRSTAPWCSSGTFFDDARVVTAPSAAKGNVAGRVLARSSRQCRNVPAGSSHDEECLTSERSTVAPQKNDEEKEKEEARQADRRVKHNTSAAMAKAFAGQCSRPGHFGCVCCFRPAFCWCALAIEPAIKMAKHPTRLVHHQ